MNSVRATEWLSGFVRRVSRNVHRVEPLGPDLNLVVVTGEQLLLVESAGAGLAVHLVPAAPDADARPAVPAKWFRPGTPGYVAGIESYDRGELESARWSTRALCGREWMAMAAGDRGPLYRDQPAQYAPTCRRCLAIVDRRFPPPTPDGRIGLVAELAARAVEEHGSAEIIGVPGEQTTPLRAELRRLFKSRFGYAGQTVLLHDVLLVTCDQVTEQARGTHRREAAERLEQGLGAGPVDDSGWRTYWHGWHK